MSIDDIEIGAIVRLNCGVVKMTVDKIDESDSDGAVQCIWFDDLDQLNSAKFHVDQLVPA